MNRITLFAVATACLAILAAPAHAVTLTATPANSLASGSFSVNVVPQGNNTFSVTVTGNDDGRKTAIGGPVKHSAAEIAVGFLRSDFSSIAPDSTQSSGATTTGGAFLGGNWYATSEGGAMHLDSPGTMNDLGPFGENSFSGIIRLASSDLPAMVAITLHGGTQQWFGQAAISQLPATGTLAPEPGALALALPGLLPMAFLLRGRRAPRQEEEE